MTEDALRPAVACLKLVFLPPSEVFIAEQLKALRRYAPLVLAVRSPDPMGLPAGALRSLDRVNPLARGVNRLALKLGHTCPYFEGQVRRAGSRLIHAQFGTEAPYGLALKARTHLPLVTSFLGYDVSALPRRKPHVYRRLFAEGDLFLACSEATRKQLLALGCPDERLRVHHLGVDVQRIPYRERQAAPDGAVNLLLVGRMVQKKGIPYALQAFATVHRYQRRATLTVIGDGPERPAVEAQVRELGLGAAVRLLGAQPHEVVLAEMERAHIYLQPSITAANGDAEGIPVGLMEAMASGLPVVATWHAGLPELVADGQSGFLVSERNSHALAERLRHLVEHQERWSAIGRAGRAIVEERFNLQRQAAALEGLYDDVLASARGT
ncbi:MAG TPA: glycosyltransferase [Anaerolineae bacterium]|nr:glycosyltransferase [Anaerolineae bacterium]HOQ97225.1 glycosyltransferase [Anaerolineae bacterium]HPL26450.1 glycosyltransferase [Anaerolineae bacterium]